MKKLLLFLVLVATLPACHNHQPAKNRSAITTVDADDDIDSGTIEKLALNNGSKWNVDASTNNNIVNLQEILKKFDNGQNRSLAAYTNVQLELQQGIDKMIAGCKMKGPDHQALHKWLKPLIEQAAKLKKATDVTNAELTFKAIKTQIRLYSQYFELPPDAMSKEKNI
jgi:hypothetical protein